ncbi:MAG: hypothetical protein QGG42_06395, partial [Phycisphaerae bacterium]|nr:hypothetical protein [Phycisphaerae bacterium]
RVTLVWPDGAIANQWVEVTVLATADTGLAAADVFYFGNAVGETSGDGVIGQAEYDTFKSQFGQRGGIGTLASDFDGDGRVGLRDFALMRSRFGAEVQSPTIPAPASPAAAAPAPALLTESTEDAAAAADTTVATAVSPVVDLLVESPLADGYVSESQATSAAPQEFAATGEYDLKPLSDDQAGDEQDDDLLADLLAESALTTPL